MELLRVQLADELVVRLIGPPAHAHTELVRSTPLSAHMSVSDPQCVVDVGRTNGSIERWSVGDSGPFLFEDTRYQVVVESLMGTTPPTIRGPLVSPLRELQEHEGRGLTTATLNFGRSIGRTELVFGTAAAQLSIGLEVFPTKLDYEADYTSIVADVANAARGLALEFLRATYSSVGAEATEHPTTLEWVVLLENEIASIEAGLNYIAASAHRVLTSTVENRRIDRISRVDPTVRRAIARGIGTGELQSVRGVGPVRPFVPSEQAEETLDTPEHRWLRFELETIARRLSMLLAKMERQVSALRSRGREPSSLLREVSAITRILVRVRSLMQLEPIRAAGGSPTLGAPSLTLLNGMGYRECYQSLMTLRLGLGVVDDDLQSSLKDLHDLYETWCFLRVAALLSRRLGAVELDASDLVDQSGGLSVRLRKGQASELRFRADDRVFRLLYNPRFSGLTGTQQPDIVLEIRFAGWPPIVVVFDAKYRLDSSEEYRRAFKSTGPPIEAVNALHRYRDAIVEASEAGRPTVKGIALFPLNGDAVAEFVGGPLHEAISSLGVGALPFAPTSEHLVDEWLGELLGMGPDELANPGPPNLAWEHVRALS